MKSRPILFSSPMVRAILDGYKIQTRRVMKIQPPSEEYVLSRLLDSTAREDRKNIGKLHWIKTSKDKLNIDVYGKIFFTCPYGEKGDRLWVRETWNRSFDGESGWPGGYAYKATTPDMFDNWKPSIFMPCEASRISLEITNVQIERLQDISKTSAVLEGLKAITKDGKLYKYGIPDTDGFPGTDNFGWEWHEWEVEPVKAYRKLWEKINGAGSWDLNPFVWVINFKQVTA